VLFFLRVSPDPSHGVLFFSNSSPHNTPSPSPTKLVDACDVESSVFPQQRDPRRESPQFSFKGSLFLSVFLADLAQGPCKKARLGFQASILARCVFPRCDSLYVLSKPLFTAPDAYIRGNPLDRCLRQPVRPQGPFSKTYSCPP